VQSANVGSDVCGALGDETPVARLVRTTSDTRHCTDVQISRILHRESTAAHRIAPPYQSGQTPIFKPFAGESLCDLSEFHRLLHSCRRHHAAAIRYIIAATSPFIYIARLFAFTQRSEQRGHPDNFLLFPVHADMLAHARALIKQTVWKRHSRAIFR
jgi:hypothetical protein